MKTFNEFLNELSTDLLARYKTAAGKEASAADKAGDFKKGNKRFSGIMKATKKQFHNDLKKEEVEVKEGGLWDNIHAKRKRIKSGSGEKMRRPGTKGAPTAQDFKDAAESVEENFINGKGPGKPGDAVRHGLKNKSKAELQNIRSSDTASPRKKQLAHWLLNMHH
jgi:hypothetical protein